MVHTSPENHFPDAFLVDFFAEVQGHAVLGHGEAVRIILLFYFDASRVRALTLLFTVNYRFWPDDVLRWIVWLFSFLFLGQDLDGAGGIVIQALQNQSTLKQAARKLFTKIISKLTHPFFGSTLRPKDCESFAPSHTSFMPSSTLQPSRPSKSYGSLDPGTLWVVTYH